MQRSDLRLLEEVADLASWRSLLPLTLSQKSIGEILLGDLHSLPSSSLVTRLKTGKAQL
jgi:hypothetical protein